MSKSTMHIGKLAKEAGTTTRTVRYYEEMGLIEPEHRSAGGFRCYSEGQLQRLQMILSLKELGFDLENIKCILEKRGCNGTGGNLAADVLTDMKERLCEVNRQIEEFETMRTKLLGAIDGLCRCLPCEVRLEERLCGNCEKMKNDSNPLAFFHAAQLN